jgi:hypothetical protein
MRKSRVRTQDRTWIILMNCAFLSFAWDDRFSNSVDEFIVFIKAISFSWETSHQGIKETPFRTRSTTCRMALLLAWLYSGSNTRDWCPAPSTMRWALFVERDEAISS